MQRHRQPSDRLAFPAWMLGVLTLCAAGCQSSDSHSSSNPPQAFNSAEAAVQELVGALRAHDNARVAKVLGSEGRALIDSGDPVADQQRIDTFLALYDRHHAVHIDGKTARLVIGDDDWEMPIPVVSEKAGWQFDTESGKEEMLARRVGENELDAISVCRAIVDAQQDFAAVTGPGTDGKPVYAQRFLSTTGTHDGLYWEAKAGEAQSPLGALVADAVAEGYESPTRTRQPFHGYYFRMLSEQGASAPGGARSYIVNGRMTGGFATIAWPAAYDNSGIMTFLISDQGVLYQRDLGNDTARVAATIAAFDPGEGWVVVPD